MSSRHWTWSVTTRITRRRAGCHRKRSASASRRMSRADVTQTRIAMLERNGSRGWSLRAKELRHMPEPGAAPTVDDDVILRADGLVKHFPIKEGIFFKHQVGSVKAVDGVSFAVRRGETLGLVGETGCGQSARARSMLRLHSLTAGKLVFDGTD